MTVLNLRSLEEEWWQLTSGSMLYRVAAAIKHGDANGYRVKRVKLRGWAAVAIYREHLERGGDALPLDGSLKLHVYGVPVTLS